MSDGEKKRTKSHKAIQTVLKMCVSVAALAFVFSKVDFDSTWQTIKGASVWWLLVAVVVYVVSQVLSSERVRGMLSAVPVKVDWKVNVRLYWLGMFYNFFLPGGVGGDGYKVYWLHRRFGVKIKPVVMALLGDRISGLVAICCYTIVYASFRSTLADRIGFGLYWLLILIPIGVWVYRLFFWLFQRNLVRASMHALLRSIVIQGFQMLAATVILVALGERENFMDYMFLFLLSSIASAVPITLGGIGAREMAFMLGSRYLSIDQSNAVSLSILFYAVSLVSSLPGVVLAMRTDLIDGKSVPLPPDTPDLNDAIEAAEDSEENVIVEK